MEKRKRSMLLFGTVLLLGLLVSPPLRVSALSITVDDVECVYEFVLFEGDTVSGNFVVVDHDIFWGSDHPVIDLVTSPGGNTVHTMKGTSGDKFEFKAPRGGMYKFCFHNPRKTRETVSFYIHSGHIPNEHQLAKDAHRLRFSSNLRTDPSQGYMSEFSWHRFALTKQQWSSYRHH